MPVEMDCEEDCDSGDSGAALATFFASPKTGD